MERRHIRRYGDRPARTEERVCYVVQVQRSQGAISAAQRLLRWRLYPVNAAPEEFSLAEAVWAYRGTPRIDRDFRRLKGYPLGIRPLYVQRDDQAQGMVRFLSLARRMLTLVKYVVMSNPTQNGRKRAELPA